MSQIEKEPCAYCDGGGLLDAFGIAIAELPASKLVLFKEQSHKGRVIVASKHHVSEIVYFCPTRNGPPFSMT
ncbi:hypothetical protein ABKP88_08420 [Bifidobacterium bifidum]|uniref:hypothetical protein n=1 Tax=Bifidobacterium bifidum TaxID=1681 RepID=UPI0032DECD01